MELKDPQIDSIGCPDYWQRACDELMDRDRILKKIIPYIAVRPFAPQMNAFSMLARAIICRQLSEAVGERIWQRLEKRFPHFAAEDVLSHGQENLLALNIPKRKVEYLLGLSNYFLRFPSPVERWGKMDDEDVINELTKIKGISRSIAEEFLIFYFSRPDILPIDNRMLLQAVSFNYFSGEPVTRSEAREVAINWMPWRSVATWYMWQSMECALRTS